MTTSQGFSVFMSNVSGNGVVAGTFGRADGIGLGLASGVAVSTLTAAQAAVQTIKTAVGTLGTVQGAIGTLENRLQFAISLSQSQIVNNKAAESRIRDANIAEESANMTRYNILSQSGIAALSQANQTSSSVLALLR